MFSEKVWTLALSDPLLQTNNFLTRPSAVQCTLNKSESNKFRQNSNPGKVLTCQNFKILLLRCSFDMSGRGPIREPSPYRVTLIKCHFYGAFSIKTVHIIHGPLYSFSLYLYTADNAVTLPNTSLAMLTQSSNSNMT